MSNKQNLRQLGNTELMISPIGLGTWQFSKRKNLAGKFWPELSDKESYDIVKTSYEQGINWFDTAELYGNGESERTLTAALKHSGINDRDVMVATKWSPFFRSARSISKTIGQRQEALNGYTISLHQVHNPMSFSSPATEMDAMAALIQQGSIRYAGVSNFSANQMRKAHEALARHGFKLASNQVQYNLLQRKIERNKVLETAKELGIAIIAYSPLAQGVLTGKYHDDPEAIKAKKGFRKSMPTFKHSKLEKSRPLINTLKAIATRHEATAAQVALSWLINFHGRHVFAIPGASNARQAGSNALAMQIELSQDELEMIDRESQKTGL
ncbi:MAG: aldo/keto reductase [Bacteroidales bacterium]|nr:aldo/keto reductase [Bacteroidales bacterium]